MRDRADDHTAPLERDLALLDGMLDRVLAESGRPGLRDDVARLRQAANRFRAHPSAGTAREAEGVVEAFDPARAEAVARALTVFFQLANVAEDRHRVRVLRARGRETEAVDQSLARAVASIRSELGEEELRRQLDGLSVTLVLTAHPTEARRRVVVEALRRVAGLLARRDDPGLPRAERSHVERRLLEEISVLWRTEQIRPQRLAPLDEVRSAMAAFDHTIFRAAPLVYRELDRALGPDDVGARPPGFGPFLQWSSWVGGDRDGNPFVTAGVTREALGLHAEHAVRGLEAMTARVGRATTVSDREAPPSPELLASLQADEADLPEAAEHLSRTAPDQAHRRKLLLAAERLSATRTGRRSGYPGPEGFADDVALVQRSLVAAGAARAAFGELQHLAWQVSTFAFHLASLEVRQHSEVHTRVLEELAPGTAGNAEALDRLATEGWSDRPERRSEEAAEVLATLEAMADLQGRFGSRACHRYVVSFTRSPADVVAVRALARLADPEGRMRLDVVPLFESAAELRHAPGLLDALFSLPGMRAWLDDRERRVEVMLGYSDSTKEMGFLAANVALHNAQASLGEWAERNGVVLTLFHGRGGALGRGGGPAARAILGQAPRSLRGRLKVTEQGEVVFARYASLPIALRHLEQVTNAVILASTKPAESEALRAEERYGPLADRMAGVAERAYRELVEEAGFPEFFARVTPIEEISMLRIGSRPPRRAAGGDLGSLRAIPWVFAWIQNRVNLPGWYGLGTGLAAAAGEEGGMARLRDMSAGWPFFRSLLENAQLSLAKADMAVAERYLELGERPDLTSRIQEEHRRTEELVLEVTGRDALLEDRPAIRRAVQLRNPVVDALSFLQLRALRQLRSAREDGEGAARLAMITLNGVAAGLQDTG